MPQTSFKDNTIYFTAMSKLNDYKSNLDAAERDKHDAKGVDYWQNLVTKQEEVVKRIMELAPN